MKVRRRGSTGKDDSGAVLVLYAILLTAMLLIGAIVIDLAALRQDRIGSSAVSDLAATAGALDLESSYGGSPFSACVAAWNYFLANTPSAPQSTPSPCGVFSTSSTCDETVAVTASKVVGPYTVTITTPVPDASPLMEGRSDAAIDGAPCGRIGVEISRTRGFLFGPVVGELSGASHARAVAMSFAGTNKGELVSLVLLDPTGCQSLVAKGQAKILVRSFGDKPGIITLDSSGTYGTGPNDTGPNERKCATQGQDFVVDAVGTQNSKIEAQAAQDLDGNLITGAVYSFALMPGQRSAFAYEPGDVTGLRLIPRPSANDQITRRPIDHRYNCKLSNNCQRAATAVPYIDNLRAQIGCPLNYSEPCSTTRPAGFYEYPLDVPGASCRTRPQDAPLTLLSGNWWINCPTFDVSSPIILPAGNIVFQGGMNLGSSTGSLTVNDLNSNSSYVAFRNGNMVKDAQSSLTMLKTSVYIHNGIADLAAGSGAMRWIAPTDGDLDDLALWSESGFVSTVPHLIGGQAGLAIEGVFFIPNALFRFAGQGAQSQTKAQFVTFRMEATGQGVLEMQPDPERIVLIPILGVRLIR